MRNSVSPGVSLFTHALSEFLHVWAGEEEEGEKENFFPFSIWMRRRRPFLSHTLLHAAKRTLLSPPPRYFVRFGRKRHFCRLRLRLLLLFRRR